MESNLSTNTPETIKVLSFRIYKRVVQELGLKPIELEPNVYNPNLVCWIFKYDKRIADIINEEKFKKYGGI